MDTILIKFAKVGEAALEVGVPAGCAVAAAADIVKNVYRETKGRVLETAGYQWRVNGETPTAGATLEDGDVLTLVGQLKAG